LNIIQGPIYTVPQDFAKEFFREFPDYRIRWSFQKNCWLIEQKCGRNTVPTFRVDRNDDRLIRMRDGYWLVMELQPGDRMACPTCGHDMKVAHERWAESTCQLCLKNGRDGRAMAGYFPFGPRLMDHIRKTDPLRGGTERARKEQDLANQRREEAQERATSNIVEAGTKADFNHIFDIQSVGYTGNSKNIHLDKGLT